MGRLVSAMTLRGIEVVVVRLAMAAWGGEALLTDAERERAARFRHAPDRARFVAARAWLRRLLGERLGVPARAVPIDYSPTSKPGLPWGNWRFNVSHSGDLAAYAFARGREVGVDVEAITGGEAPHFFHAWTRKEALFKAMGCPKALALEAVDPRGAPGWRVAGFSPAAGFAGAVAWKAT
jgi:phosphopantetheinyl transferase